VRAKAMMPKIGGARMMAAPIKISRNSSSMPPAPVTAL
jgi:hypothetical protein